MLVLIKMVRLLPKEGDDVGRLTLAAHALTIDADAAHHDIVNDREAAFAPYPIPLAVLDAAVCQDCGLVELHASQVELLGERPVLLMEEIPGGPIDDLVRSVAEDINNGVGRVEDVSTIREVCSCEWRFLLHVQRWRSLPWIVMKVVSILASAAGCLTGGGSSHCRCSP